MDQHWHHRRRAASGKRDGDGTGADYQSAPRQHLLHFVLDEWIERDVKPRLRGKVFEIGYADDRLEEMRAVCDSWLGCNSSGVRTSTPSSGEGCFFTRSVASIPSVRPG